MDRLSSASFGMRVTTPRVIFNANCQRDDRLETMPSVTIPFVFPADCPKEVAKFTELTNSQDIYNFLKTLQNHPITEFSMYKAVDNYWLQLGLSAYLDTEVEALLALLDKGANVPDILGYKPINAENPECILVLTVPKDLEPINPGQKFNDVARKNYLKLLQDFSDCGITYPGFNENTLMWSPSENTFYPACPWLFRVDEGPKIDYQSHEYSTGFLRKFF